MVVNFVEPKSKFFLADIEIEGFDPENPEKIKKYKEQKLVDAANATEVEKIVAKDMEGDMRGDYKITCIKLSKIQSVLYTDGE